MVPAFVAPSSTLGTLFMNSKRKPIVGETLYSLNVGNAARKGVPQVLTPVKVVSVGLKLFRCRPEDNLDSEWCEVAYRLEDWREHSEYSATFVLYQTEQERLDEVESFTLSKKIGEAFEWGRNKANLSIERLRRISSILDEQ
jgi:hypothetical protein